MSNQGTAEAIKSWMSLFITVDISFLNVSISSVNCFSCFLGHIWDTYCKNIIFKCQIADPSMVIQGA